MSTALASTEDGGPGDVVGQADEDRHEEGPAVAAKVVSLVDDLAILFRHPVYVVTIGATAVYTGESLQIVHVSPCHCCVLYACEHCGRQASMPRCNGSYASQHESLHCVQCQHTIWLSHWSETSSRNGPCTQ